jgi:hypothetical protein
MTQDFLVRRIRESLLRLSNISVRTAEPVQEVESSIRDSIRNLARSRVSLLLRQLRAAHNLTYAQVQTNTGLSQQLLFDVEFKDRRLTLDELRRLAACYQVSVSDILGVDIE